ncbi:MAG: hypothetical protein P9M15_07040 [Candidatus Electryoneaceae bacterium]|nr:hypothetical protein [Candidatus Electryoneaceae bacterium]
MYLIDEEKRIIHDMSFVRYECKIRDIPEDQKKKVFSLSTVKRMVDVGHVPQYNGCQYCMSEYHTIEFIW